jgi:hypothetical protein
MIYSYRPGILVQLREHGVVPRPTTDPALAYEHLKSLYSFRIRQLRNLHRELEVVLGPQPLDRYRQQLKALRDEYPALRVPSHHWTGDPEAQP